MGKIIFIGRFFSDLLLKTANENSKGYVNLSNHNFEISIINGLKANEGIDLSCITVPDNFSYPYHHSCLFTKGDEYVKNDIPVKQCSLCNLPIVNSLWATILVTSYLLKQCRDCNENGLSIMVNCPKSVLMLPVLLLRIFLLKRIKTVLIVPDIPSVVSSSLKSGFSLKSFFVKFQDVFSLFLAKKFEHFVLLTEQMNQIYKSDSYIVMEGLIDIKQPSYRRNNIISNTEKQILLYTGSLHRIYGILKLIEAFIELKFRNVELWICGSGDSSSEVAAYANQYHNIYFYGMVSRQEVLELQENATILVNPRTNSGNFTKYSFPSKTLEYLIARKPVIMYRLDGVPSEYYNYVYTPQDDSIESLKNIIEEVLLMDPQLRDKRANRGYEFILENKNSKAQMKKIIDSFML